MISVRRYATALVGCVAVLVASTVVAARPGGASEPIVPRALEWVDIAATPNGDGYWVVLESGDVSAFGRAAHHGDLGGFGLPESGSPPLRAPIVGLAANHDGSGYWLAAADGGVFTFGAAKFHGSAADLPLVAPIVAIAPTPTGNGYWLLGADGGVFSFGDAPFLGRARPIGTTAEGLSPTPSGRGYFVTYGDVGPESFGDAVADTQMVTPHGDEILVDVAAGSGGKGAWLVDFRGAVYAIGGVRPHGGTEALHLQAPIVAMTARPSGDGYWLLGKDGGVFTFGAARFHGRP